MADNEVDFEAEIRKLWPCSTRSLDLLPSTEELLRQVRIMAALDVVVGFDWWSYQEEEEGIVVAYFNPQSASDLYCIFTPEEAILKGFDHQSEMSPYRVLPPEPWPGMYDGLPEELAAYLRQPEFKMELVTFCIWRRQGDSVWSIGPIEFPEGDDGDDGSHYLLNHIYPPPERWHQYHNEGGGEAELGAVQHVYETLHIDEATAKCINPEVDFDAIRDELRRIGLTVS